MSVCVYALAARGTRRSAGKGVAGERLRTITVGPLDAIVGDVTVRPRPTAPNLLRYDRVVTKLWEQNRGALLPARFGTFVRDAAELDLALNVLRGALRKRLALVRNRAQMTVLVAPQSPSRQRVAQRPRARSGTAYLRAVQAAHDVPQFAPLRAAVRRWVRSERVERQGSMTTIYHLIPRGAVDRYRSALERAAHDTGVRLYILGPRPAYAFADVP